MSLVKDQIQLISQGTTVLHYCTVSSLHYVPSKCAAMSLDMFASVDVFKPCGWPKIIIFFMWSLAIIVFIHGCVSPCGVLFGVLWFPPNIFHIPPAQTREALLGTQAASGVGSSPQMGHFVFCAKSQAPAGNQDVIR